MTAGRRIRAVFFDIGNVLLTFSLRSVARKLAFAVQSHPLKLVSYLWDSRLISAVERGELAPRKLYGMFIKEFGYTGDYEAFKNLWCDHFTLELGTAALLKKLAKTHRVYLLSNTNYLHYEFIRKNYEFPSQVHGAVLSYRLKMRKPEERIYRAALKLARVKAKEAVFIDDLKENVAAAGKIGINAIHYAGLRDLKRRLAALGLPD